MSNDTPITILNFPPVLGQIRDTVATFNADWQGVINNQNQILQYEITIINLLRDQTEATANLVSEVRALNTNIGEVVGLMTAIIQAFAGVATQTVQEQQVALLQQLLQFLDKSTPLTIGLDLSGSTTEPQRQPAHSGP